MFPIQFLICGFKLNGSNKNYHQLDLEDLNTKYGNNHYLHSSSLQDLPEPMRKIEHDGLNGRRSISFCLLDHFSFP